MEYKGLAVFTKVEDSEELIESSSPYIYTWIERHKNELLNTIEKKNPVAIILIVTKATGKIKDFYIQYKEEHLDPIFEEDPLPNVDIYYNPDGSETGKKFDSGKLRLDLIPPEAMESLGEVLTFGAEKYGDRNWEKGIHSGRLIGATLRHLYKWMKGDLIDPETGLSHLSHAFCNLMFLVTFEKRDMIERDIVKAGNKIYYKNSLYFILSHLLILLVSSAFGVFLYYIFNMRTP